MKTIKIIDLVNMRMNNEEMPKKFKYNGEIFIYDNENKDYIYENGNISFIYDYCSPIYDLKDLIATFNKEVEIIEEDKKIEKFTDTYVLYDGTENEIKLVGILSEQRKKINELIDVVNSLKEKE